jgi:hypothetical protein
MTQPNERGRGKQSLEVEETIIAVSRADRDHLRFKPALARTPRF